MADSSDTPDLPPSRPSEPKASILLVDDNPANLRALRAILDDLRLNLVVATSGEEALRRVLSDEFAVILLDVHMPVLDGYETATLIRGRSRSRHVPIIFLTAQDTDRSHLERGYLLGAVDFLVKPLVPLILRAKVGGFVELFEEKQRARREGELLRLIVDSAKDYAIFVLDPQGRVVTWNAGAERLKGYGADEIVGQHFSRFYPQNAIDRGWPAHELKVARDEGRFEDEGWRLRKDGTPFWANVVITALRDDAGSFVGFSKITRDLTERKRSEENARRLAEETAARQVTHQERERLRVTLASIGDAVISTDAEGRVDFLNPVAEELVGWKSEEAARNTLADVFRIVNETTRQPVENPVEKVLREGVVVGLANHTVLVARDGTERPIDDSAAPIRDAAGRMIGVVLIFRDVTEQRRADRELRASEARKSAILETALDCIITMDHEGNVVDFNPAAEKTFGYRRAEIVGRELCEFIIPPAVRDLHRKGLAHYLATGEGPVLGKRLELSALRADGSEFPVEVAITRNSEESPAVFTAYLRDVSEAKRAERHRNARLAVTHALSEAANVGDGASGVLRAVCENLGWDVGFLWRVGVTGSELTCAQSWHKPEVPATEFERASLSRSFARGEGLPGSIWSTGQPTWLLDVLTHPNFPRAASAAEYDLHSAFGCPVVVGDRTLGVIEFFTKRISDPDAGLLEMMGTVAGSLGQFLERQEAEDELRRSERELTDFFENATVGLHWVGPDGIILRANRAELALLGYSREEYVGRPVADFHADDDVICDILHRLKAGEQLHDYPARLRCKDGTIKDVLIDSSVLFQDGTFTHTRCFTRDVTEQKRAERGLREAQRRLQAVFNQQFQFMAVLAPDGTVLEANETCFRATGVGRERVVGRLFWETPWWDRLPAMQGQWRRHVAEAARGGGPVTGDVDYSLADGTLRHATTVVTGLKDESGRVTTVVVEGHDDTERKRNEAALAAQKRVLELLVHGAPLPDVLDALCEAVEGQRPDKLIATVLLVDEDGKRLRSVAGRRAPAEYARAVDGVAIGPCAGSCGTAAYRGEQVVVSDIAVDPLWAEYRDVALAHGMRACWSSPIISSRGGVLGTFAVYYPSPRSPSPDELRLVEILTRTAGVAVERRRDEAALRGSEQTARILADASAALAVLVDFDSTLQKVSSLAVPSFADWVTVDLAEPDGSLRRVSVSHIDPAKVQLAHDVHRRFPPDPAAPQGVWNILRTGRSEIVPEITDELLVQSVHDAELLGSMRQLGLRSYIGVPLTVRGKTLGVITFISAESGHRYDNTDLAVAEELASRSAIAIENAQLYRELRDADRRKDEFLATLAHELRNPLAPIRNALQILKMPRVDGATVQRSREMMERQVHQLVRLVDDLLDVSRVMRGKIELRREKVELATVVARAVETVQPLVDAQGHELSVRLPSESLPLDADPVRLAQVVGNLLTNAAKYTEANGRIWLTAERSGDMAVLRVRDTGIGIDPAMLPHIFELFVQVDHASTKAQGGLGIGLTLVKNLVEMHNGTVEALSAGLGKGSEFVVRLPISALRVEPDPDLETGPQADESPSPSGFRLLVVDDNQDAADSLAMLLRLQGHEVRVAHSGMAALEMTKGYKPGAVFLDIGMPGMDGYEVARRLRQQPGLENVVLAALTGWGQHEDRRRTADAGFDHHLVKPPEPKAVEGILAELPTPKQQTEDAI